MCVHERIYIDDMRIVCGVLFAPVFFWVEFGAHSPMIAMSSKGAQTHRTYPPPSKNPMFTNIYINMRVCRVCYCATAPQLV